LDIRRLGVEEEEVAGIVLEGWIDDSLVGGMDG
jgi:hypothetical protein